MKWMIDRLSAAQVWVVLAALWFGAVGPAQAQVQVRDARVWPAPDHVRFVLDLGAATRYSVFTLDNPHRVVIDLTDARLAKRLDKIDLGSGPIKGIRTAVRNDKDIRIVLDLSQPIKTNSFTLEPNDQYGHRLVV
ncbi:MAG: AMIN domain-containing protein, partial [Gammaproteobacteria bacterium]|nr:AMIN domain-containing protein [Gammaproteobacteria bacterium]